MNIDLRLSLDFVYGVLIIMNMLCKNELRVHYKG